MKVTGATLLLLLALLALSVLQTAAWEDAVGRTRQLQSTTASNPTTSKKKCTLRPKPAATPSPATSGQNSTAAVPKPTTVSPKPTTAAPSPDTTGNEADPSSSSSGSATGLNFAAKPDGLYLNGAKFTIKGANYFGMEGELLVPHGLWGGADTTTLDAVAKFLTTNNFNAVRLTLAVDAVRNNKEVVPSKISNEKELQTAFNGKTLRYLDVLDYVVDVLAKHKILVLLNCHMLVANAGISPLWYTSNDNRNWVEDAWKILATRYKNTWNVIGADLKNEPHGEATWGSGDRNTDWRIASLQMANSIHKITSKWLIFVEGMDKSSRDDPNFPCFWGENLMDVQRAPLELSVPERLVYSPHVYGPSVSDMSYFHDASFPSNMPAIWDKHFGFIRGNEKYNGAMVIGEWGGAFEKSDDQTWQRAFAKYLKDNELSWFYWTVNPNAGDTKGLLEDDWATPRDDKMSLLSEFKGTPVP
ncbi:Cellulase glycosyl hydrolase, partial [Globisporangium splendens]